MIADPEHEAAAELLGVYVLDAVEADEARRVERHVARCARCRTEVDQLREVAASLGNQLNLDEAPPPAVWDRIADVISASAPAAVESAAVEVASLDAWRRRPPARTPALHTRTPHHRRAWLAGAAAAAAAAVAALSVSLVAAEGRVSQLQSAIAGRPPAPVRAALASPGHRLVSLRSGGGARVAELVIDRTGVGYVVSSTMSGLPADETYQLWASISGKAISIGLLGHRLAPGAAFTLGSAVSGARALMVTVEPAGGVVAPDRAPIAIANLTA